ncbi:hypothetical protein [Streptomyces sp. NPDC056821]|uniref:hypothetical protein n=1 Tax=unclassified Streptomyces TaxID=2593676 RepID=UPI0036B0FEF7
MRDNRTHRSAQRRWPSFLPAAVIVAAIVLGLFTRGISTFPLLAAAPVLAAPVLALQGTITTGVAGIVIGELEVAARSGGAFLTHPVQLVTVVALTALAAVLNRLMARYRQQLKDTAR